MKKLSITYIASSLIFIGIFFIPFNSWEGIGVLGEFYRDSCFLFFSIAFMLLLFKRKIKIPHQNIIFQFQKEGVEETWIGRTGFPGKCRANQHRLLDKRNDNKVGEVGV